MAGWVPPQATISSVPMATTRTCSDTVGGLRRGSVFSASGSGNQQRMGTSRWMRSFTSASTQRMSSGLMRVTPSGMATSMVETSWLTCSPMVTPPSSRHRVLAIM